MSWQTSESPPPARRSSHDLEADLVRWKRQSPRCHSWLWQLQDQRGARSEGAQRKVQRHCAVVNGAWACVFDRPTAIMLGLGARKSQQSFMRLNLPRRAGPCQQGAVPMPNTPPTRRLAPQHKAIGEPQSNAEPCIRLV